MFRYDLSKRSILLGLATALGALALLEALIAANWISAYVVPPPSDVLLSFGRIITEENILARFSLTTAETLGAGFLLTVCGIALGGLLHRFEPLRRATETWVAAFASAPLVLAYPLFLVVFGRSALTIIVIGFLAGLAPVALKTLEGLRSVRPVLINTARVLGLTSRQQFWKIQIPAAAPTIFLGVRLGLTFALINIIGVEFLINFGGLGQLINELSERYDLAGTYAAICFVVLVSILFFAMLEKAEQRFHPATSR